LLGAALARAATLACGGVGGAEVDGVELCAELGTVGGIDARVGDCLLGELGEDGALGVEARSRGGERITSGLYRGGVSANGLDLGVEDLGADVGEADVGHRLCVEIED